MEVPPTLLLPGLYLGSEFNGASRLQLIERNITAVCAPYFGSCEI